MVATILARCPPLEPLIDPRDPDLGLGAMQDAATLEDIRLDVEIEIMGSRSEIQFITILTVDMTIETLEVIRKMAKKYTLGMLRLTKSKYYPYLEDRFKQQFAADEESLMRFVKENEDFLHEKLHEIIEADRLKDTKQDYAITEADRMKDTRKDFEPIPMDQPRQLSNPVPTAEIQGRDIHHHLSKLVSLN